MTTSYGSLLLNFLSWETVKPPPAVCPVGRSKLLRLKREAGRVSCDELHRGRAGWGVADPHRADVLPCKVVRREFAISRIAHGGGESVSKIDVSTNTVTATVTVGDGPDGVGFDGSNIWVANFGDGTGSKIVP